MGWGWGLLVLVGVAGAQDGVPVSRAEVRLEVADGRTAFKLGDVIRLELVFRDVAFPDVRASLPKNKAWMPVAGQKTVNGTDYGDIADEVTISPATGWVRWQGRSGHDYMSSMPLDEKGVKVGLVVNEGYVFREAGHYEISVTTGRMSGGKVTTNAVGIDVEARTPEEEAGLVKTLDAAIASSDGKESRRAAEALAYLPGDDAARAKVKWLVQDDEQGVAQLMVNGLAATKNQGMQLELLRAAWVDPGHAPDGTLQWALKRAEAFSHGQMEAGWTMVAMPKSDAVTRELAAEYSEDLDRVIATLPQRTGMVRRDTAYYLMEDNALTPAQMARVKPVVLEEFARMEPLAQAMLIETKWEAVKDESLAPVLKGMIESKAQNSDAATAVERLVEIDEAEAKPYVIEMVCRAQRGLLLDKLKGVKEDRLPEVDECLAGLLTKGERREHDFDWEQAAQRAARFATRAILPKVKAAWVNPTQDASMLALLVRDAPKEAVGLLEREPEVNWYPTNKVYEVLPGGRFPPEVLAWLRGPKAPKSAGYELGMYGEERDRLPVERRLESLRREWAGRGAEMTDAQPGTEAYAAKSEEQELVSELFGAKAWTLTEEEKKRVLDGCVGDWCERLRR